jgi:ribosome biogenesis GTPase
MTGLHGLGFDAVRLEEVERSGHGASTLGRVIRVDRGMATLETGHGPLRVDNVAEPFLVVGDFAAIANGITHRFDRRTELVRRSGYRRDERQVMAANVDVIVVVRALDTQLSVKRLATLVVIAHDSGATPLVVLTKADVVDDATGFVEEAMAGLPGVEVMAVSMKSGVGLEQLRDRLAGKTVVLLGESGAGKSTLTNVLLGADHLATTEVRRDGQGRHTTTHRELVTLPGGGAMIDTPGIREAAAIGEGEGVELAFADLTELETTCRFSDCTHQQTPGCALEAAVAAGDLDAEYVDRYLRELDERAAFAERLEQRERLAKRGRRR